MRDDNQDELTMMTFNQLSKTEYYDQKKIMTATATISTQQSNRERYFGDDDDG